jgi:hypothetical protein
MNESQRQNTDTVRSLCSNVSIGEMQKYYLHDVPADEDSLDLN